LDLLLLGLAEEGGLLVLGGDWMTVSMLVKKYACGNNPSVKGQSEVRTKSTPWFSDRDNCY
jgi:hypothetical protein